MPINNSRIVIGTVRFSGLYGINNNKKILRAVDVQKILNFASKKKIKYLDTAIDYKKTNNILSNLNLKNFNITSKLPGGKRFKQKYNCFNIRKLVIDHLKKLKVKKLHTLYLHQPDDILKKDGINIIHSLQKLKKEKKIKKIGYSIYSTKQLKRLLNIFKPDIIQCPLNIFDRRFLKRNFLNKLQNLNIEIHIRSIFFQGGLISDYKNLKKKLLFPQSAYDKWVKWLKKKEINKVRGALSILYKLDKKVKIVIGVESIDQLSQIVKEINKKIIPPPEINLPRKLLQKIYNYPIKN